MPEVGLSGDTVLHADAQAQDDTLTAAAIGALAFIATMIVHEALGHGSACAALGGRAVVYPVSMQCSIQSNWMVAAGPLANLVCGVALWSFFIRFRRPPVHIHRFLWLTIAFNLFNTAGYLGLGAATGFGDWGVVLGGISWPLRVFLVVLAGALYYGFMCAVAVAGSGFLHNSRGWRLTLAPYLTAGIVACAAALRSPFGRGYLAMAAAASVGAGLGLPVMHDWGRSGSNHPLVRSLA